MRVFYGFTRLTPKVVRKPELAIYFENAYTTNNDDWINRRIKVVYTRRQTLDEEKDAKNQTRMFTKYSYLIDEKPFFGDIDKVLHINYIADEKNVDKRERLIIRKRLREEYFKFYNRKESTQLTINFF